LFYTHCPNQIYLSTIEQKRRSHQTPGGWMGHLPTITVKVNTDIFVMIPCTFTINQKIT